MALAVAALLNVISVAELTEAIIVSATIPVPVTIIPLYKEVLISVGRLLTVVLVLVAPVRTTVSEPLLRANIFIHLPPQI